MKQTILVFALALCSLTGWAQVKTVATYLGSATKRADHLYENFYYQEAIELYKRALKKNPDDDRIKLQVAEAYRKLNNAEQAEIWYRKAINNQDIIKPEHKLYYAQALLSNKQYWQAEEWYVRYQQDQANGIALDKIKGIEQMPTFYRDSVMYTINEMSTNSPASDFSPAFYDSGMVFVSARATNQPIKQVFRWNETPYLDLFYASIDGKKAPRLFNNKINTIYHEGPAVFFNDDTKVIFTRNAQKRDQQKVSRLALLYAERSPGSNAWSSPTPLNINDRSYSVGHPAITEDGKTLYFISDMPGGFGGTDIYVSLFENGEWQTPANLGNSVNTPGDEMFLFLHNDQTLYYASNGRGGLGGLDTYRVSIGSAGVGFSENVGYPINTSHDDFGFILNDEGDLGYFSSNRKGETADDDIYQFTIRHQYLDVVVYDERTNQRISNAEVTLIGDGAIKDFTATNEEGAVHFKVNPHESYIVNVDKQEYSGNVAIIGPENMAQSEERHETKMPLTKEEGAIDLAVTLFDSYTEAVLPHTLVNMVNTVTGDTLARVTDAEGKLTLKVGNQAEYKFFGRIGETDWNYGTVKTESLNRDKENAIRIPIGTEAVSLPMQVVVLDAEDKSPVEYVTVRLVENQQQRATLRTSSNGTVRFKVAPKTDYSLSIKSLTHHDKLMEVTPEQLMADTLYLVEVLLDKAEQAVSTLVHLHDADTENPIANTVVRVKREDTGEELVMMTDKEGNIRLKLEEGVSYRVSGEIDGEAWAYKESISVSLTDESGRHRVRIPIQQIDSNEPVLASNPPSTSDVPATTKAPVSATLITVENRQKGDQIWVYMDEKLYALKEEDGIPYLEYEREKISLDQTNDSLVDKRLIEQLLKQINASLDDETTIQNVYFDFDKYDITPASAQELKKVVALMNKQPSLMLEVSAHTDSRGAQSYNLLLSKLRAKSVVNYLLKQKIASDRIKMLYYGEKQPLQPCGAFEPCNENIHKVNRRAEFEFDLIKVNKY